MAEYVIGVDGGNTKTHYALFDMEGNKVSFYSAGTVSHECLPGGYEGTRRKLEEHLDLLLSDKKISYDEISYAVFGLAGVDVKVQQETIFNIIKGYGLKNITVCNDAFLGVKAGSETGYGVCSINGGGTCCVGIDPQGNHVQIGGIGYIAGDEAGASYLGTMTVRRVYESIYKMGSKTLMKDMLFEKLQINSEDEFVDVVQDKIIASKQIKVRDLTKIPFLAANEGDKVALDLLASIGTGTANSVVSAINRLNFGNKIIDIVMAGSVYVKGENDAMINAFKKEVKRHINSEVRFTLLQEPPVLGAIYWALEEVIGQLDTKIKSKVSKALRESTA